MTKFRKQRGISATLQAALATVGGKGGGQPFFGWQWMLFEAVLKQIAGWEIPHQLNVFKGKIWDSSVDLEMEVYRWNIISIISNISTNHLIESVRRGFSIAMVNEMIVYTIRILVNLEVIWPKTCLVWHLEYQHDLWLLYRYLNNLIWILLFDHVANIWSIDTIDLL